MKTKTKVLLGIIATPIIGFVILCSVHNKYTDYINPFMKETISYAAVPTNTQVYKNVDVYTPATKKHTTLQEFTGYDHQKYVKVYHKGQFVREIRYISAKEYNQYT